MENLLPGRLGALLALDPDRLFAERLRRVLEAAGRAISKLGELDLVKYEDALSPEGTTADLSLWEELAPIMAQTVANVSALVSEIAVYFPEGERIVDPRCAAIGSHIQAASSDLRNAITHFGQRMREPSVVGDAWNLLIELETFRSQFRERIGGTVYDVARNLGDCKRSEVEPGYDEALSAMLMVRSTTADLQRLMRARILKVGEAAPEDVEWNVQQTEKELNAFGRTSAWRALQAADKRVITEFRYRLRSIRTPELTKVDLLTVLEPFVEFVDGLRERNARQALKEHDQEMQAAVGVVLERALNATSPDEQRIAFTDAVDAGQSLYGRAPEFDAFLRRLRKAPPAPEALPGEVEQYITLLAGLAHA